MRRSRPIAALLAALALGGCALFSPTPSWVEEVNEADATELADAITGFLKQQWPVASTTLVLEPPEQADNPLTPALEEALRQAGFALADPKAEVPGAHRLRYLVSPMGAGVLLRLQVDQTEASRWFVRDRAGALEAASPFTVRDVH